MEKSGAEGEDGSIAVPTSARTVARQERAIEERDRTRSQILEAARGIIRDQGVLELSVVAVTEVTELTRTTIYRYFDGPNEMVFALSDETMQRIYARIDALDPTDPRYLDTYSKVTVEEFCSDSVVNRQAILLASTQRFHGELASLNPEVIILENLRTRQASGLLEVDDVELAARAVVTYFRGALYGWAAGFYTDEEFATEVARSIEVGLAMGDGKEIE